MKRLIFSSALLAVCVYLAHSAVVTNFCGQNLCCSTPGCNSCASNCQSQCVTENCVNNCIDNCVQTLNPNCPGNNCNVCSGSDCCNNQYCNTCANSCNNKCSTPICKNNCINKCIETTPSCVGENCNICVGGQCCNNHTCNNCVNQCYTQTSGCTKACVRQCIQPDPIKIALPIPEVECEESSMEPSVIAINTTTNSTNRVNITTTINLHNIINNTNIINSPVYVNNSNINHVHFPSHSQGRNVTYVNTTKLETLNHHHHGCCYVLHPRECFYVQKNQTERQIKCIRRRHKECSPLCTSSVVLIMPVPQPYPQYIPNYYPSPIYQQQQRCHYVQQYPWVYCGNYQTHGMYYNIFSYLLRLFKRLDVMLGRIKGFMFIWSSRIMNYD